MKIRFIKVKKAPTAKKNKIREIGIYHAGGGDWMPDSESYLVALGPKRTGMRPGIKNLYKQGYIGRHVSSRRCLMRDGTTKVNPFR